MPDLSIIGQQNSTTYADVAGVHAGFNRLPGETSDQYLDRLARSGVEPRSATYDGLLSAIALQLGLDVVPGISIDGPADTTITCDIDGIHLAAGDHSISCSLVTLDEDEVWNWKKLSEIVAEINSSNVWTATLLSDDGPAVQLSRQTNAGVGMPYECVVSPVGLIGLTEPSLPTVAATPSGGLAYQVREFIQAIAERDRAYWAR
jgi:hypothetical protein